MSHNLEQYWPKLWTTSTHDILAQIPLVIIYKALQASTLDWIYLLTVLLVHPSHPARPESHPGAHTGAPAELWCRAPSEALVQPSQPLYVLVSVCSHCPWQVSPNADLKVKSTPPSPPFSLWFHFLYHFIFTSCYILDHRRRNLKVLP